jgi:hypothetical protein
MRVFFFFLDGVGLGADDPAGNPLAAAPMPALRHLLEGRRLLRGAAPFHGSRASLLALDACLGVPGLPQSATGQAVLLTGLNVPARSGGHYGPKPNQTIAAYLQDTLFSRFVRLGKRAALLNAYPEGYFQRVRSGKWLYSAIPQAVVNAGLPLFTAEDFYAGRAVSADLTGHGWRERLGHADAPLLSPRAAGRRLAALASNYDFAMFEYWPSDYAGHGQDWQTAVTLLKTLDGVLDGLVEKWDDRGLIVVTSDHGNLEDLSTRRHTPNPVPCLLIGPQDLRRAFAADLPDLTGVAGAIERVVLQG